MEHITKIAEQFRLNGHIDNIVSFGSGHIHKTFHVSTSGRSDDYILQALNINVFRDPGAVTRNIDRITRHIQEKLVSAGEPDIKRKVLHPVPAKTGEYMLTDPDNGVWRCFIYIPDHLTFDKAVNPEQVLEGGKAFGGFLRQLSDMDINMVSDTIPDFHNLEWRLQQFTDSVKNGWPDRIAETQKEIDQLFAGKDEMLTIRQLGKEGKIPLRVVHHDTKINNVLYDRNGKALCVIDLDTVMAGYVHDDFGDAIRTFTNTGEEDDINTDNVSMNISYFEAFARGYLMQAGSILNEVEKHYLPLSARVMTYMQVLRFLADYLNGDTYYKIHHPMHNLQRTFAQLKLLRSMEEQYDDMRSILDSLS